MPAAAPFRSVPDEELATALAHALRYQDRKRVHHADDAMARITAERLIEHLERSGFVVMKGPDAGLPQAPAPYRPE
ncbi:MAG: hypothetical protein INR62_05840 [Rhodospirillales bacterium]|nr:hypothetical protein [Acetobacter sp.]